VLSLNENDQGFKHKNEKEKILLMEILLLLVLVPGFLSTQVLSLIGDYESNQDGFHVTITSMVYNVVILIIYYALTRISFLAFIPSLTALGMKVKLGDYDILLESLMWMIGIAIFAIPMLKFLLDKIMAKFISKRKNGKVHNTDLYRKVMIVNTKKNKPYIKVFLLNSLISEGNLDYRSEAKSDGLEFYIQEDPRGTKGLSLKSTYISVKEGLKVEFYETSR